MRALIAKASAAISFVACGAAMPVALVYGPRIGAYTLAVTAIACGLSMLASKPAKRRISRGHVQVKEIDMLGIEAWVTIAETSITHRK